MVYLIDLDGVENEMLVKLRADLADLDHSGQGTPSHLRSEAEFRRNTNGWPPRLPRQ